MPVGRFECPACGPMTAAACLQTSLHFSSAASLPREGSIKMLRFTSIYLSKTRIRPPVFTAVIESRCSKFALHRSYVLVKHATRLGSIVGQEERTTVRVWACFVMIGPRVCWRATAAHFFSCSWPSHRSLPATVATVASLHLERKSLCLFFRLST